MNVLLFGASGMLGQGVLRQCLGDDRVSRVLSVVRQPGSVRDPKLHEVVRSDLYRLDDLADSWRDVDACFFCLGVSSAGMAEAAYRHVTYDLTVAVAQLLARVHPQACFVYVSGAGTDSGTRGRSMWARVKGATENALLALPLHAYMLRPGLIQPLHGAVSKTPVYRWFYRWAGWLLPIIKRFSPHAVTTTEQVARAMLTLAQRGYAQKILLSRDINQL